MSRTKNDERPAAGRREVVYFAVYCVSSREAKQSRVCGIDQLRFAAPTTTGSLFSARS